MIRGPSRREDEMKYKLIILFISLLIYSPSLAGELRKGRGPIRLLSIL
jgi:hypothetical protein